MSAEGNAVLLATQDIVFDVAHNTERSDSSSRGKGWGFANNTSGLPFGTNNSQSQGSGSSDTITGTQLSVGGGVRMATTEGNISLTAANIAAEKDVSIRAAGDLLVRSGQDTVSNANTSDSKAIGSVQISDTEKFSGWHREQHQDDSAQVSQVASSIGSLGGSVNLTAGGKYTQTASNVVAAKDVNITAAEIELLTADESGHYSQSDKDLKIGVFARVKSPLIDLINNVDAARQSDDRLQKMQGMAAGANAYQAASAISALSGRGGSGELFRAEAGIGFKTANSSADGSSSVSRGSTIQGGGNVNLTSTQGDIHVVQGNLSAGNTLSLDSAGDILLEAGKAHVADRSKSSNAGAEVGVGVSVGAQTGVYVYAEASVGSSKANAESSTWQNTTLTGKNISMKAEGDTTLRGATATADRIDVKTGGTLTIESLQDIAESMSRNSQVGGRVQVSFGTAWNADGYASAGKASGSYQGVGQQSGLFSGNGGYHVDAGHVNLVGGAIASTHAGNSELTADSLTFTDLQNHMDYAASSGSISGGAGGQMNGGAPKPGTAVPRGGPGLPMMEKGSDSSSTLATLTEGNITIGGKQTSAAELGINTDASGAHRALEALPDASKLLADQQAMAAAAGTVMATSQQIAWEAQAYQSKKATQAYYDGLSTDDKKAFNALSAEQRDKVLTANSQAYNDAKKWGDGGEYSRALGAVTTALVGGVAGQGAGQVASNALAPYAAYFIGSKLDSNHGSDPNATLQLLSHAVLGALLAEANGGNAGTGAVSAAGGELAAKVLTSTLTGGDPSKLSPGQKEMVLALSQAVGALASGLSGQDLAGIALNAGIAKNSVENNWLSRQEGRQYDEAKVGCKNGDEASCSVQRKLESLSHERDVDHAGFVNAAREALVTQGYAITPAAMAAIENRYWQRHGEGIQSVVFTEPGMRPTQLGALHLFADAALDNSAFMDRFIPGSGTSPRILANTLIGLGQTVGAWTGINPVTGLEVVGVDAFDARFMTVVDIATAAYAGGSTAARAAGKSVLRDVIETSGQNAGRNTARDLASEGMLPVNMLPDNIRGTGLISGGVISRDPVAHSNNLMSDVISKFADPALKPKDFTITIDGKFMRADPVNSINAPIFQGASDNLVKSYFMQLGGVDSLPLPKSVMIRGSSAEVYTLTRKDGVSINLRNGSSSSNVTGAKWTIDIMSPNGIRAKRVEIKFK
ncbi:hemagglutinin repeat-containing protein [Stenotrophomonas maltophilia]|uniref:hemagglutinin repeat-containing protein n=1 Tax=Stenotrophomonas maltophilia TaxID=40324 RepID=UPI00209A8CA1|nr:hemagglutinin repeat-containing protein [Stenotrophomonas maltophilia]MCO7485757.1 hemagglutinin repeat-containing protein [Stenotrophomonas maltophilia]